MFSKEELSRMKVLCNGYLSLVQSTSYLNTGWKLFLGLWGQMIFFGHIDISRGCIDISRQLVSLLLEDDVSLWSQKRNSSCEAFWEWYCLFTGTTVIGMRHWRMNVPVQNKILNNYTEIRWFISVIRHGKGSNALELLCFLFLRCMS